MQKSLESDDEMRLRMFESLCGIIDREGAKSVMETLQVVSRTVEQPIINMATAAVRDACMRAEGAAFGKLYDAHMCLMPLIVRGSQPSQFPGDLDELTARQLQGVLRHVLDVRVPNGSEIYPLPVTCAYTHTEFFEEKASRIHEILQAVFNGIAKYEMNSAPKYVRMTESGIDRSTRVDDEMHDLKQPGLGVQGWFENQHNDVAGNRLVRKLHRGHWITMRLVPVVLLVPHGEHPPTLDGFAYNAVQIGQMLSFASHHSDEDSMSESVDVKITPLGLYDVDEGPMVARLAISSERLVSDALKAISELSAENALVDLSYQPDENLLRMSVSDGSRFSTQSVMLPGGLRTQMFIEELANTLMALGLKTKVNMGDAMIRLDAMSSLALH